MGNLMVVGAIDIASFTGALQVGGTLVTISSGRRTIWERDGRVCTVFSKAVFGKLSNPMGCKPKERAQRRTQAHARPKPPGGRLTR